MVIAALAIAFEVVPRTRRVSSGSLEPPSGPGLGVEIDEAAAERYPYDPENFMRLFEPGWEQRLGRKGR